MTLPNLPAFYDMKYTQQDGSMTHDSKVFNDQTFQTLNALVILVNQMSLTIVNQQSANNVIYNGLTAPSFTTAEIVALEPSATNGTMWYNSTLKKMQFKADSGVIETITSTP